MKKRFGTTKFVLKPFLTKWTILWSTSRRRIRLIQRLFVLQSPQIRRIRRRDVDHKIVHLVKKGFKTNFVVPKRFFIGRYFVFTNIATNNDPLSIIMCFSICFKPFHQFINTFIVETHAVYQSIIIGQTEKTRLRVAVLGLRCDCSNFYKTKAQIILN